MSVAEWADTYGIHHMYIYIVYIPQYCTTHSDELISTNSVWSFKSYFEKKLFWEWEVNTLTSHSQNIKKEVLLLGPSSVLHILTCLWQG